MPRGLPAADQRDDGFVALRALARVDRLSARWPGDAYPFPKKLLERL